MVALKTTMVALHQKVPGDDLVVRHHPKAALSQQDLVQEKVVAWATSTLIPTTIKLFNLRYLSYHVLVLCDTCDSFFDMCDFLDFTEAS